MSLPRRLSNDRWLLGEACGHHIGNIKPLKIFELLDRFRGELQMPFIDLPQLPETQL